MNTPLGTVRICRRGPMIAFRVEGRGQMGHSLPLRHAAEDALADGANVVRVDLSGCEHVDSTFVGTLLVLGTIALDHFAGLAIPVESLAQRDFALWDPSSCPLCAAGTPLEDLLPSPQQPDGARGSDAGER